MPGLDLTPTYFSNLKMREMLIVTEYTTYDLTQNFYYSYRIQIQSIFTYRDIDYKIRILNYKCLLVLKEDFVCLPWLLSFWFSAFLFLPLDDSDCFFSGVYRKQVNWILNYIFNTQIIIKFLLLNYSQNKNNSLSK